MSILLNLLGVVALSSSPLNSLPKSGMQQIDEDSIESSLPLEGDEVDTSHVNVILKWNESRKFLDYNPEDFGCPLVESVVDLTSGFNHKESLKPSFRRILRLNLKKQTRESLLDSIRSLRENDKIYHVGFDTLCKFEHNTQNIPNDPNLSSQWCLDKIHLKEAWSVNTGSSDVKVAIIDSGISGNHEDLIDNVDASMMANFTAGENTIQALEDPYDHGTPVAGIIGAKGNNNKGIAGVCWDVDMVSVKTDNGIGCSNSVLISAINYCENNNIKLINLSSSGATYSEDLRSVISSFHGLIVTSAGNSHVNIDSASNHVYPACYDCDNLLVVGNSKKADTIGWYTNWGQTSVDLFAPGNDIYSTSSTYTIRPLYDNCYTGTSFSTPLVTGTAALLMSEYPGISVTDIKNTIMQNGDTVTGFATKCVSGKRLNVYAALSNHIHTHEYNDHYVNYNSSQHKSYCACGAYILQNHALQAGSTYVWNGHTYGTCVGCGAEIDLGTGPIIVGSAWDNPTTQNGSFMLPSGIIILNPNDIIDYLENTLPVGGETI